VRETSVSRRRDVAPSSLAATAAVGLWGSAGGVASIRLVGKRLLFDNSDVAALDRRVIAAGYPPDAAPRSPVALDTQAHGVSGRNPLAAQGGRRQRKIWPGQSLGRSYPHCSVKQFSRR